MNFGNITTGSITLRSQAIDLLSHATPSVSGTYASAVGMKYTSHQQVTLPRHNHSNRLSFFQDSKQTEVVSLIQHRKLSISGTAQSKGSLLKASAKLVEFHLLLR